MEKAKPGGWYFYVECSNPDCRKDIIFQEAPPPEKIDRPKVRGLTVVCPHCQQEHTYPAAQVARGQVEGESK
jgi:ribosomal protein S27E